METPSTFQENTQNQNVSIGDWLLTLLIMGIPLINLIMLFVWAFGNGTKPSKANWAKASLIMMLISIGIIVLLALLFGSLISSFMNSGADYY